jgi:hypothetical protein
LYRGNWQLLRANCFSRKRTNISDSSHANNAFFFQPHGSYAAHE